MNENAHEYIHVYVLRKQIDVELDEVETTTRCSFFYTFVMYVHKNEIECVCAWMRLYIHMNKLFDIFVYVYMDIYICTFIYTCVYVYTHIYKYMYIYVYIWYVYIYVYIYIYICMYVYIYIYIYIHVYAYMYLIIYLSIYLDAQHALHRQPAGPEPAHRHRQLLRIAHGSGGDAQLALDERLRVV